MVIRDRGKIKWQPASFIPLAFEMQRTMFKDQERQPKPLIDKYEREEFDKRICYAMELNLVVMMRVWNDGFAQDVCGHVHFLDPITHQVLIEVKPGEFERINFKEVVSVVVLD